MTPVKSYDVAIIGAGVLGVCTSYWLSMLYDSSIALIDKEDQIARHASSRNTGVIHRPFYLDPEKKKIFAASAEKSYYLWKELAIKYSLPWKEAGTLEVAMREDDLMVMDRYRDWSSQNGMDEKEFAVLEKSEAQELEPEVKCLGAFYSKTDTSVDYGAFSHSVFELSKKAGVNFLPGSMASNFRAEPDAIRFEVRRKEDHQKFQVSCKLLINLAGGSSIDVAHSLGLGKQFTDLHFRGEYWVVNPSFGSKIKRNVYSVPKFREFPFLDPHFIVRASESREIGPNAVLVFGPSAYEGLSEKKLQILTKLFERPNVPKLRLFTNGTFLSLVWHEAKSSFSKDAMCERVRTFLPNLNTSLLSERGIAGIRSSVIDNKGFVPEAVEMYDDKSVHILNYNSPGATGAPAFSWHLVEQLRNKGYLGSPNKTIGNSNVWASSVL